MRTLTLAGVLLIWSALDSNGHACSTHGLVQAATLDYLATGSGGVIVTGLLSIESFLVAPTSSTVCMCGIGMGTLENPLPDGVEVVEAAIVVLHADGSRTPLPAFMFVPNNVTSVVLAAGSGSSSVPGTNPLFPGATWFGFSSAVEPFVPPVLGLGESTALEFSIAVDKMLLPLELSAQFAAGEALSNGAPIFSGDHPAQYFAPADPSVVLTAPVPEPSSLLMLLLATFLSPLDAGIRGKRFFMR